MYEFPGIALNTPPSLGDTVQWDGTRWVPVPSEVIEETFDGNVSVSLNRDAWAIYTGPIANVSFTANTGNMEQRVKSYLIPAGMASGITLAADLNVNEIDAFDVASNYLLAFTFFSGVIIGTGRIVV